MSTTTPAAVEQICCEIESISEAQFAEEIRHYEMACGLTADSLVEMDSETMTLRTTFQVRGDDESIEEVSDGCVATGLHLFGHSDFSYGTGWTKYDETAVCRECVVPVSNPDTDCPHCGADIRAKPSLPDTIEVEETVDIQQSLTSVDDIETALASVFGTSISIQ